MQIASFREIIDLWPKRRDFTLTVGSNDFAVAKWYERNSIPPKYWDRVINSRVARRNGLNSDLMLKMLGARKTIDRG